MQLFTTRLVRHNFGPDTEVWMKRNTLVDVTLVVFATMWLWLAFDTIKQAGRVGIIGATIIGMLCLLLIAHQRIAYLRIGNRFVVATKDAKLYHDDREDDD